MRTSSYMNVYMCTECFNGTLSKACVTAEKTKQLMY